MMKTNQRKCRGRAPHPGAGGFSLPEVLIASVVFLVLVVGLLPLFTQSGTSNVSANESTTGTNLARSQIEELYQLPFNSARLAPTGDDPLEEYYSAKDKVWKDGSPPASGADPALWLRTTSVAQYHISALDDGILDPEAEALPAGSAPEWIQLKEITVRLESQRRSAIMGPPLDISFQVVKSQ